MTWAQANDHAIEFRAKIATIDTPGQVQDICNRAWDSVRHHLVTNVSVGFLPKNYHRTKTGYHYTRWLWTELSLVTSGCNPDAVVVGIRSLEDDMRVEIAALRAEIAELKSRTMPNYRDVYQHGEIYRRGDMVTYGGAMWIVVDEVAMGKPGDADSGFKLCLKSAKDGRSAYEIARKHGFNGSEGEWVRSLRGKDATIPRPSGTATPRETI